VLTLAYLYGDLMNLYGDRGNIIALQRRCAWERVDPGSTDLIFFGGGQDREQETVSRDLDGGNGARIHDAVEEGAALLAVCGGYQLLGRYFHTSDGTDIPGVGLFDAHTEAGPVRNVGNVVARSELTGDRRTLVGFENHSGRTFLGSGCTPLATVLVGQGNNGDDSSEGARYLSAIGTYLHGPLLPKNPWLADWLIRGALRHQLGTDPDLPEIDDQVENRAHAAVRERVLRHGNLRTSIR
jgi:CobQ-like glutamine amidotransferase family enzyme